tara:strand:+ start:183 stop:452 length:270 start_codon:yes stop_codon:yes gene_type:complete
MINSFRFIPITLTSYSSSTKSNSSLLACGKSLDQTYYHNGSSSLPAVNDSVYSDSAGTSALIVGHYKYTAASTMQVSSTGVVLSTDLCV